RQIVTQDFGKRHKPNRVTLKLEKVTEGGSESRGVLRLGVTVRAVGHRVALIDHEKAAKIRFIFEFLDEVAIGFTHDAPINEPRIIARRILTIFGKFDRKTVVRTAMEPIPKAFHNNASTQLHIMNGH